MRTGTRIALLAVAFASLALATACGGLAFTIANAPTLFGNFERRAGLAYGEGRRRTLDVYLPQRAQDRPVVVFWYGGSWQAGLKGNYRFVGAALAREGFVAVLPDYRVYPQVRFPDFLDDAAHAVVYVHEHAREWGGDPSNIVVMGHSAGAHLAAMLALDPRYLAKAGGDVRWIKGLIGLSGPYALEPNSPTLNTIFAAPYEPADWQPVRHASPGDPPTLLLHGLDDQVVSPRHTDRLRDALTGAGVSVDAELYPGRGHADTVAAFAWGARSRVPTLERVTRFIASVTSRQASHVVTHGPESARATFP